jgi:hypothetical protein
VGADGAARLSRQEGDPHEDGPALRREILGVRGSDVDRIEPANGKMVGLDTLTDGTWIWSSGLRYYVEKHGIAPEPDFLAHMAAHDHVTPVPDEAAWRAALDQILRQP